MNDPFAGMPGVDETQQSTGADPFAGMPGASTAVAGNENDPASKFTGMLSDPDWSDRLTKQAARMGTTVDNPEFQARMQTPMGFRARTTLMQLADTGNPDETDDLDAQGRPTGLGLKAALMQFGQAGGAFRRRNDATISRIAAGQELEVGDTREIGEQIAKGMAGMPRPNMRVFKKIEDMTRAEQDATVPQEVLDIVNQNEKPGVQLDPKTRAQMIYDAAKAGAMSREQTRQAAKEEIAIREELTGKSDGLVNTVGNIFAQGMPSLGASNNYLVAGVVGGALASGMDKTTDLLTADIDPDTGEVKRFGEDYDTARARGYGYGAFEAKVEKYFGKALGVIFRALDKVTGGYAGKVVSKGLDKAADAFSKTAMGRGIAVFARGTQRIGQLSARENPLIEGGEEAVQQWADKAFAQRSGDTEATVYAKNVFNEATGQIEQVPVEPGSDEEKTARRQIAHYGDKSEYVESGKRQMTLGEKSGAYAKDFYTWQNMADLAESFALQYVLQLGGGALHAVQTKETRGRIDKALLMAGANNADLVRMSDEQKAEAFEKYYGNKENQAEFAAVFKDAGDKLSDMAQRMQDARLWQETGNSLKPNFETDLAKAFAPEASGATGPIVDETSNITVSQTAQPEGMAITVHDNDGVLNDVTVNSVQEAQMAAERMSQLKQGRQADMNNRAEIATRLAQTFAPGRKLVLVHTDADMRHATQAEYEAEGVTFTEADAKAGAKGATTPGGTIILNVAAATGVNDLVSTIGHETGHSVFTQSGMAALMKGKGLKDLADELQRAKILPPDIKSRSAFLSAVMEVKAKYELQGVKLDDAGAAEEVLANMNEGADPVIRKQFADNFVNLYRKMRGTDQNPTQTLEDARRTAALILHSGAAARVEKGGVKGAWEMPAKAFDGDPVGEGGQKASVAPAGEAAASAPVVAPPAPVEAQGEAPAPVAAPVEAPAPKIEPPAEVQKPAEPPKTPMVFKSVEEFAQFFSEHPEAQDWEDGRDFVIKPEQKEAENAVQKPGAQSALDNSKELLIASEHEIQKSDNLQNGKQEKLGVDSEATRDTEEEVRKRRIDAATTWAKMLSNNASEESIDKAIANVRKQTPIQEWGGTAIFRGVDGERVSVRTPTRYGEDDRTTSIEDRMRTSQGRKWVEQRPFESGVADARTALSRAHDAAKAGDSGKFKFETSLAFWSVVKEVLRLHAMRDDGNRTRGAGALSSLLDETVSRDEKNVVIDAIETGVTHAFPILGAKTLDVQKQAGDGEGVGKGNTEGGAVAGARQAETEKAPPEAGLTLDGGTAADIDADKAKLAAQEQKRKEREEIEAKAKAPIEGTMGDMTGALPGMADTTDIPLFDQQKPAEPKTEKPTEAPKEEIKVMGVAVPPPEPSKPAEISDYAEKNAKVGFASDVERGQYAEVPGVSTKAGKRVYLERSAGSRRDYELADQHEGIVKNGMAVLLRTKGESGRINAVRMIGGAAMPEGSKAWGVDQWIAHNQKLAKGKESPKAPEASKPAEPKVEEQKPPTEAPKPTFSKMRFPSEAAMEAWVVSQSPEALAALPEDWFEITGEQVPEASTLQPEAKAPEAAKPEFTFRKMRLGEPAFKYNREKEAARKAWEVEQAKATEAPSLEKGTPSSEKERQVPSEETSAKSAEESEEARQNIETRDRMRAIPDVDYKAAPALAAIDAEIPAYEARKAAKVRTADSKERQAYSTPPPLAAIGAEAAKNAVTIVEPTAGNGGLLAPLRLDLHPGVSASQMKNRNTIIPAHNALTEVLANELDPERAARLQEFLGRPVSQGDYAAEDYQKAIAEAEKKGKRAFLMNPPFGPSDKSGYKLEHRIALKTIESAVPGDSLFFIGAAPSRDAMTVPAGGLAGRYTLGEFAKFHEELNRQGWAPKLHFIADGALYRKMGAAFPVEVLLMEKTSKPGQHRPMRDLPGRYSTWEDIRAAVAQMYDPAAPKRITDQVNPKTGELDLDSGNARFRLTDPFNAEQEQKILTGQIEPVTNKPVPAHFLKIFGKMWLKEFGERAHNPSQLAAAILDLPTETAHARIGVADAIADFLINTPETNFQVSPGYVSMSLALRDEFHNRFQAPVAAAGEREADLDKAQIPYEPYSDVSVVSPMMIPRDLALAMHTAMNAFMDRHPEGVDAFVAERMKWTLKQATDGRLDGSQMDTLALALDKVNEGSGFIVGSQTGAGKGRVMAAVMAHHIKYGRTPVFFTAKANLFTAMWEDITAIGEADLFKPLVYNNYQAPKVDSEDPDAEDVDGFRMPMFFSDAERKAAFHNGKLPKGATAIFTTYSQIQNQDESAARKTHLIESTLRADGGLVMDEAHLAAGEDSNTGAVLRRLADTPASGVVFSSATFAKRGENMTLYKRAGYSRFFKDDDEMSEALKYGKLPFQQYLAARLTEGGYYTRHELDYAGIVFDQLETTDTVPLGPERTALANREMEVADTFNTAIRTIMRFAALVKAVNAGLQKGSPTAQINSAAFMSSLHNIASFIYTALKAETVGNAAVAELRAGRAPVITLYNTNQALLEQIGEGNEADVGRYLTIIAEKAIAITLPDGSKLSILSGEGASHLISIVKEADAARIIEQARGVVRQARMSAEYLRDKDLPASPIDRVREIVEAAGFNFGELTGRSLMVKNGVVTTRVRPDPNKIIDLFNNSLTDEGKPNTVILLNSSGSTGLSIHNSPKFKNVADRVMFVLQPMWDINEMMQTFGRVNRKDQKTKPAYRLMFTSAAGEQRNAAILMQKLRSLSANTSGVSKAGYGESADDNLDFMNVLGDKALVELTKEKFALISTINMLAGGAREIKEIRRATAVSQFLPVAEQAEFIAQVQGRVAAMHEDARESGMHDLEAGDIGRVPLTPAQIATGAEMRAYEVPVTGKAKIILGAEAIAMAKTWQAENENLLADAKRKIDVAVGRTQNAYLHAIYARTAQTLEHVVDSIGRVWYVQNTDGSGRTYFIPVGLKLAQNGSAHTAHEWRVRVSFNNIRGLTTIPMTIFTKTLLDPAGEAFSHNYNASLSRKDDRTLIAGDIAKALIGNIINAGQANGGIGMPRIVRAYPMDSDFASFVLMMPRGISVPTAQRIVSSRLVPVTDVQDIIPTKSGGWLDIDAGRVRIAPTYNSYNGEMIGTEIGFRIATPRGAKSGDVSVAAIMRAAGFSSQVNTPPDSKGYVTVSAGIEQSNTALANLAKLSPYLQAKQVVTDGAQGKARFLLRAEGEQTGPRGMGPAELRRYLISSLGYTAEQVDGLTPTELVRLATKPDDYFTPFGRQGGNARFKLNVTPEQDKAYMEAVGRGDMVEAQRMVDEAAKKAGYNVGPVYHGTNGRNKFNEFKSGMYPQRGTWKSRHLGFFFSESSFIADQYGGRRISANLKLRNPARVTAIQGAEMTEDQARSLRKEFESKGHDGVIIGEESPNELDKEIIVFNPSQIKSADPVTRDNQGRVIPLSERFNEATPDIRFKLSDPIQVGTLKSQEQLEEESNIPFPVLNAMRGASKLVIPYVYKGGAYDWFRERGGLSSFTLAERLAFFKRPSNPENTGNIDALAQELGFSDTEEFANAFLNEIQRSRELYNAQKVMMDARRGALATAAETFPGRSSQDISRVMGQAVDTLSYIFPPDIRADIERIGDMEGEEAVRNYILTGHFEAVLMEMAEQFSYEGRDDTKPEEIQDEGTYARPEVIDKKGNTAETLQQTKARIAVIAATLGVQQPQGVPTLTDEAAAAQIREMIEREGVDVAMGAARNLVAQRLAGQRDTPLNKAEAALMLRYQVYLDARLQASDREVKQYFDAGDLTNLDLAETERQHNTTETMEYLEAMRKYGSLAGQALQALKMRVDRSFNIVNMYQEAVKDNGDLPLTPEQYAKLRARVAKLEQAWADYVDAASMPDEETDLNQRVKDLEADIGKLTGEIASRQGETAEAEQKLIALRIEHSKLVEQADVLAERRAGLQGEVDRLETEIAFRKALAQEVESLQAKVDKLNAQLLSLDAEYAGVDSRQLRELEKRLTELTAEYNAKRAAYEKAAEELKTANQRLKRVLEMIKRLEKGTKSKIERRRAVKQQAANLYGVFKAEMEAAQLDRLANQWRGANPVGKLWIGVTVLQNIVRATQSSGDESVAGRQLAKLGISHPLLWLRAFRDSQRLMFTLPGMPDEAGRILSLSERSDRVLFEIDQMMREHPLWQTLRKAGLDWIDLTSDPSSIDEQQLPVAALLRRALPSWTGREAVATVLTISNNHYAGMSNMLRFAVAAQMYERLLIANGGATPSERDLRALVTTVDIFGGRGALTGSAGREYLRFTSRILYSPRLAAANVQFVTRAIGLLGNPSYSLKARKMIASEYLRVFAGYGVLTAVAYLLSKMFSDDPDKQRFQREWGHPAFMQFMIGQNRLDFTGGFATWARYPGSIFGASDRVSTESGLKAKGERQPFDADAFVRLLRSKLTPFAGFLTDTAIGKTYGGEAAGPRARPNMPGYDKRYLNMWQSLNPVSLSLQSLVGLMQGDKEQGVQPLRNPLLVTTAMGAEMLGILASSVPVNSALAQQVEAGYTKRAEKLETLKRQQKALMSDKKLSPVIKQVRSQRLQRQIDILRGNVP